LYRHDWTDDNSLATLNPMNGGTKWEQAALVIRQEIASGRLQPGDRVMGELDLAERCGISRGTARDALTRLVAEGVLSPGSPRTVAKRELLTVSLTRAAERVHGREEATKGADAFLGEAERAGREPGQEILPLMVANASDQVASLLGLHPLALVVGRQLIRSAGGTRHNMITFWFPFDVADGTPLMRPDSIEEGSLAWLERRYGTLEHCPATIWTRPPTQAEAEILAIPPNVHVLEVWRTTVSMPGRLPVVTSVSIWPGDRAVLRIEI